MPKDRSIALMVHGGAWDIPDRTVEAHRRGVLEAVEIGWSILSSGGDAVDAVEAAVRGLEDDPTFDAGTGSMLNQDGEVELDAILMRGHDLQAGAVAAVRGIRNPISLARRVLEDSDHVFLVGAGANRFARERGIPEVPPESLLVEEELARWREMKSGEGRSAREIFEGPSRGTVGAVALDRSGRMAAGTSTGGTPGKYPGRVGDSPVLGGGCYCADDAGGGSATGYGEDLLRATVCRDAVRWMEEGAAADRAASDSIQRLEQRFQGRGGIILVDQKGRIGHARNTPRMAVAGRRAGQEAFVSL
jgi:L-asparaginase / beta-aspartyl-peptidase